MHQKFALHMMPPSTSSFSDHHQKRTSSAPSTFPVTPPLLQHHKIVSRGKLRFVYVIFIFAVLLILTSGLLLNHFYFSSHSQFHQQQNQQVDKELPFPPKLHHDDPLDSKVKTNNNATNLFSSSKMTSTVKKKYMSNPKKYQTTKKFPFYFPKKRPPQDTIGDLDCDIAALLSNNLKQHRKLSLLKRKRELEDEKMKLQANGAAMEKESAQRRSANAANEPNDGGDENNALRDVERQMVDIDYRLSSINAETSVSASSSAFANPCLRLVMFSTLKPCTDEDNIWAQFAAISSWVSIPIHPAPTVILYDTALRTEYNNNIYNNHNDENQKMHRKQTTKSTNGKVKQQKSEIYSSVDESDENFVGPEHCHVFHKNAEEARTVQQFAKKYEIDLLGEEDEEDEEETNNKQEGEREKSSLVPPFVTNYSNAQHEISSTSKNSVVYEYQQPPLSIRQNSCSWLLLKMIEKYFHQPTSIPSVRSQEDSTTSSSGSAKYYTFPRAALVAPTPRLVGIAHNTLLLGRAIHHLTKTVMPALRPLDEGVFDVAAFVNSDIIFDSELLGTILANGVRTLRRFMFVGRRHSLNIDAMRDSIRDGFVEESMGSRRRVTIMRKKKNVDKQQEIQVNGGADEDVADPKHQEQNHEQQEAQSQQQQQVELSLPLPMWHGFNFFNRYFPSKFSCEAQQQGSGRRRRRGGAQGQNTSSFASLSRILFRQQKQRKNKQHSDRIDAEDYFFWTRGFLDRPFFPYPIPPFHIGRPAFDNWLLSNAIHSNQPVVDITYSHLIAIHVESSKNKNRDKMSNSDRAYWNGAENSDTKENYQLGETHGGWQHGLLEFAPLKLQMLSDLLLDEDRNALKARFVSKLGDDEVDPRLKNGNERKTKQPREADVNEDDSDADEKRQIFGAARRTKIDDEDRNDADDDAEIKYWHRNKNEVRIGMKNNWKGLGPEFGKALESPKNYWKHVEEHYFA